MEQLPAAVVWVLNHPPHCMVHIVASPFHALLPQALIKHVSVNVMFEVMGSQASNLNGSPKAVGSCQDPLARYEGASTEPIVFPYEKYRYYT